MFAGHDLAVALGVVDSSAVRGDDDLSRRQLVRAGEAMVDAGLAIVLNRAGTKEPICTLTAREKKAADQQARDEATDLGDPRAHQRTHRCGLAHAITDLDDAKRILARIAKRRRFNIGVEPRASRVVIVDVDTAEQADAFAERCGRRPPGLTVRSPGQRGPDGEWVHKDGGHIWFEVPKDIDLPTERGKYTDPDGWTAMWGECQVLVPPSYRDEGDYVLVGSLHPLPDWLLEVIEDEVERWRKRRAKSEKRRRTLGPSAIDDWSVEASWADILIEDEWTETNLADTCACPVWTAPGDHASPKSATAHEPGCDIYPCDRGHGPLHVWTDFPSEAVQSAIDDFGTNTLTKIQVFTWTHGEGDMSTVLDELGIGADELERYLYGGGYVEPGPADEEDDEDEDEDDDLDEMERFLRDPQPDDPDEEPPLHPMVKRELNRERARRAALELIEAEHMGPLSRHSPRDFFFAPRPQSLFQTRPHSYD